MLSTALASYPEHLSATQPAPEVYRKLQAWMENPDRVLAFKYTSLKNPGWIIGAVVYSFLGGVPLDLGKWE